MSTEKEKLVCTGKQLYATYSEALHRLASNPKRQIEGSKIKPYRCKPCAGWHLGHNKPEPQKKFRRPKKPEQFEVHIRMNLECCHGNKIFDCPTCQRIRESVLGVK